MGLFKRNKVDASDRLFLEKIEGHQIGGTAIALVNLKSPAMDDLPEGFGRFYLKNDGSCWILKMDNLQGFAIEDEIWFDSLNSWGSVGNYPIFDWAASNFALDNPNFEVIAIDTGFWTIAFKSINEWDKWAEFSSVRQWLEAHYPKLEVKR
jgi:hypothetical protein